MECQSASSPESREILSAPISVHSDVLGFVVGYTANDAAALSQHSGKLRIIAEFIGDKTYTEYELRNLTEELLEKYSEITLIYDISESLSAELNRQAVCEFIIDQIVSVVGVERASIMLYDEDIDRLQRISPFQGHRGPDSHLQPLEGIGKKTHRFSHRLF